MSKKRKNVTKSAVKKSDPAELTKRLGPVKKVVRSEKVSKTAVRVTLECGHKRVVSPRSTLRCRKCRVGAKKTTTKKAAPKLKIVKKTIAKKPAVKKTVVKREPVSAPAPAAAASGA